MRILFAATFTLCWGSNVTEGADRPNVLMIAVDDLRPMLGCYGDTRIVSPNIDRLAARSVLFERAYCQAAKCGPSRLSLMTGLRPDSIRVYGHSNKEVTSFRKRRPDATSLARWLKDHGYTTHSFGKIDHDGWQISSDWSTTPFAGREKEMLEIHDESHPNRKTVIADRFQCPVMQSPDVSDSHFFAGRMTNKVRELLTDVGNEKPFFIAVGYRRPHLPFIAPKRYYDFYKPDKSWLAKNAKPAQDSPSMAWFNSDGYRKGALRLGVEMPENPTQLDWMSWNGFEMRSYLGVPVQGEISEEIQLNLLHAYAACVSYVDAQIGKLLEKIDMNNTIVIFWADHGWHLGEQSAWGKMTNFEIATRVPLMIAAPGIKPARTQTIAELVDLYPTICDLVQRAAPDHLEGESLIDVLKHPLKSRESFALSEYPRFNQKYYGRALRTDRYRFVVWSETATGRIEERELYDHATDPLETMNVAKVAHYSDRVKSLERQLKEVFDID